MEGPMGIRYVDLNELTRPFMVEESLLGPHYESPRLTAAGLQAWRPLLTDALQRYNDDWLAAQLLNSAFLNSYDASKKGMRRVNQPHAAQMLAEGEFNRFNLRGLYAYGKKNGIRFLVVYRGKEVTVARPQSQAEIGTFVAVDELLSALRSTDFVTIEDHPAIPGGPNSGLTVRLLREADSSQPANQETPAAT
jgi:hypothetical protein